MTADNKNPEYCTIRRVENGWVISIGNRDFCHRPEHVFLTPRQLATFIEDNFRLPPQTKQEGGK